MGSKYSIHQGSNLNIDKEKSISKRNNNKSNTNKNIPFQSLSINSNTLLDSSMQSEKENASLLSISSIKTKETTNSMTSPNQTKIFPITENKVFPYKFEWYEGGGNVEIFGSFLNNWKEGKLLKKNVFTGHFEIILFLSRTKHFFKFVVDGNWVCSKRYQKSVDNRNNENNYIDLTNYEVPKILLEELKVKEEGGKDKDKGGKKVNNYGCCYPKVNELNTDTPKLPWHYRGKFLLDYQSNQIQNKNLSFAQNNIQSENNSYKKILITPHEKLNHLYSNANFFFREEDFSNENENFFEICTALRIHHKFLNIVYFNPKK